MCKVHALEGLYIYGVTVSNASITVTIVTKGTCTSETIQTRTHDLGCLLASLLTPPRWRQEVKTRSHASASSAQTTSLITCAGGTRILASMDVALNGPWQRVCCCMHVLLQCCVTWCKTDFLQETASDVDQPLNTLYSTYVHKPQPPL